MPIRHVRLPSRRPDCPWPAACPASRLHGLPLVLGPRGNPFLGIGVPLFRVCRHGRDQSKGGEPGPAGMPGVGVVDRPARSAADRVARLGRDRLLRRGRLPWAVVASRSTSRGRNTPSPRPTTPTTGPTPILFDDRSKRDPEEHELLEALPKSRRQAFEDDACLRCHVHQGYDSKARWARSAEFTVGRRRGCEGCHGAAGKWLVPHIEYGWGGLSDRRSSTDSG